MLKDDAGEPNGGEYGCQQTDDEGGGEAADGTGAEVEQDYTGNDRGDVGVDNGREGIAVAVGKSSLNLLACAKLLLGTLVDKHVGIHCHTEGEHHTGNTAHGERRLERCQHTQDEEEVDDQGAVGDHTGLDAVEQTHVNHQQHEGHDT